MNEELRPCPFCGAMPDNERGVVRYDPGVICHTKGCLLECRWFPIDDWNTRPIEDALRARIAELEALVDELVNIGDNLFDSLNPIAWKHEWLDKWWKLSSCRRGERE